MRPNRNGLCGPTDFSHAYTVYLIKCYCIVLNDELCLSLFALPLARAAPLELPQPPESTHSLDFDLRMGLWLPVCETL